MTCAECESWSARLVQAQAAADYALAERDSRNRASENALSQYTQDEHHAQSAYFRWSSAPDDSSRKEELKKEYDLAVAAKEHSGRVYDDTLAAYRIAADEYTARSSEASDLKFMLDQHQCPTP
jgi:hypothetical protein